MPTKAGVMRPEDYRQGKTVWLVPHSLQPNGTINTFPLLRLECVGKVFPTWCARAGIGHETYEYFTRGVKLYNHVKGYCEWLDMEQLGYPSLGACPANTERVMVFSSYKAAKRYFDSGDHWKPTREDILLVRADIASFAGGLGGTIEQQWEELPTKIQTRKDKRRYMRIPGFGMREAILRKNGQLVVTDRVVLSKASTEALDALSIRMNNDVRRRKDTGWDKPGIKRKVLGRKYKAPLDNRTVRKLLRRAVNATGRFTATLFKEGNK